MFSGVHTALVTPFTAGRADLEAFAALVERQIAAGIHGVVPCGTTGESSTVTDEERLGLIRTAVQTAKGRLKVIAGVGTNDTARSIANARAAAEVGADAGLVITPYYNKPTQEGLYRHCAAIAEATELPLVLYNVPGRTAVSFTVDTLDRLADLPTIVAVKEATADLQFGAEIVRRCGDRMQVLSGDDATAFPLWCVGGRGLTAVASNLVPERFVALWRAFEAGDIAEARRIHLGLLPLFAGMFWETNPVPVKTALAWATGLISAECRLPLAPLLPETEARLRALCADQKIELRA
ncbi:MAG: 4-hydroxy-tetrahydrodipicolinate synthase [Actinomycetia bacterium]|nr:4-hydroxy-tetrahydrodipicolinate synthase [Actinomycetes bacterium]